MRNVFSIAISVVLLLLTGCGGGGSSDSRVDGDRSGAGDLPTDSVNDINDEGTPNGSAGSYYRIQTNSLRQYQIGDYAEYALTGSGTIRGAFGSDRFTFSGILSESIGPSAVQLPGLGSPRLLASTFMFSGVRVWASGQSEVQEGFGQEYFYQNGTGSIFLVLDDDGNQYNYPQGALEVQSPIGVGASWLNDYRIVNPSISNSAYIQVREACAVTRRENVITPIGTFETYRVDCDWVEIPSDPWLYGCPTQGTETAWIYPAIGTIAGQHTQSDLPGSGCPETETFNTEGKTMIKTTNVTP